MKRDDIFEQLEPPPFGLERLRARMDARRSSLAARWVVVAAVASALVVAVAWPRSDVDLVTLARRTSAATLMNEAGSEPVEGLGSTIVAPLGSGDGQVVMYRVTALPD